jgi:hypothetical protein
LLAPDLRLNLPNGPAHACPPISAIDESRQLTPLAIGLPTSLAASSDFDPDLFRQQMQKLRDSLR